MFRRRRFLTQLHVAERVEGGEWRVAYSYRPIETRSLSDARRVASGLRRDNRWASLNNWPHVTVADSTGTRYPEWEQ